MENITPSTPLSAFPGVGPARQRALAKLAALGLTIDRLTPEQEEYLNSSNA